MVPHYYLLCGVQSQQLKEISLKKSPGITKASYNRTIFAQSQFHGKISYQSGPLILSGLFHLTSSSSCQKLEGRRTSVLHTFLFQATAKTSIRGLGFLPSLNKKLISFLVSFISWSKRCGLFIYNCSLGKTVTHSSSGTCLSSQTQVTGFTCACSYPQLQRQIPIHFRGEVIVTQGLALVEDGILQENHLRGYPQGFVARTSSDTLEAGHP